MTDRPTRGSYTLGALYDQHLKILERMDVIIGLLSPQIDGDDSEDDLLHPDDSNFYQDESENEES